MMGRGRLSRTLGVVALAAAAWGRSSVAQAAEPSISDCLFARNASEDLQTKHLLRASRAQALVCSANSCPLGIRAECTHRAAEVRSQMPTLIFAAEDSAGREVSQVRVKIDGDTILSTLDGTPVGVDPGTHTFTFEVEGRPPASKTLDLTEGEKDRRIRLELEPLPAAPHNYGHTQRILGISFAGASLIGVALGTGFGLSARSNLAKSHADCVSPTNCTSHDLAVNEMSAATTQATISTGAFIAGGALLATGAMLYFTAPKGPRATTGLTLSPAVGANGSGFLLRGSF